jgi:hypothetical protein
MNAERGMQLSFSKTDLFQSLAVAVSILLFAAWQTRQPDRFELGWQSRWLRFEPVAIDSLRPGELRPAGAWAVTSDDPRFGGVSALALVRDQFVALTDSGVIVRFGKPQALLQRSMIGELPAGPGRRGFKFNRDSEAFAADPRGRGWWVTFENRNELWLYDLEFRRALKRVRLGRARFPENRGLESAVVVGATLLLVPEDGTSMITLGEGSPTSLPITNPAGRVSDAASLPSGELLVVNRRATLTGFRNSVALLEKRAERFRYTTRMTLRVGRLDNVEAVAPELLPNGRVRLWLMSDDNHQRPLRTLLIAVDLPARLQAPLPPS